LGARDYVSTYAEAAMHALVDPSRERFHYVKEPDEKTGY
jgi:hypothetical protein